MCNKVLVKDSLYFVSEQPDSANNVIVIKEMLYENNPYMVLAKVCTTNAISLFIGPVQRVQRKVSPVVLSFR